MPPKAKISKEMILEEAFQIARAQGADKITARSISQGLNCSTQPILYYFGTVEEIKAADVETLAALPEINRRAAEEIHGFFHKAQGEA